MAARQTLARVNKTQRAHALVIKSLASMRVAHVRFARRIRQSAVVIHLQAWVDTRMREAQRLRVMPHN